MWRKFQINTPFSLPEVVSNHSPIMLYCGHWESRRTYFKLESMWLEHEGMVESWWNDFEVTRRTDFKLTRKIKMLKRKLIEWNAHVLATWRGGISHQEHWQNFLNGKHEKIPRTQNPELVQKAYVIMDIKEITKYEEISWRWKSKCLWFGYKMVTRSQEQIKI